MKNEGDINERPDGFLNWIISACVRNKFVAFIVFILVLLFGLSSAPFNWDFRWLPRDPVSVDAIPDIGENQQIVFTRWTGRSPQDIEDQISYPLTTFLLGLPGVENVRSTSMFGFSTIYVIFKDDVDFYWARSRLLEKLNSIPDNILPQGVKPTLGPDSTALGQVFWYTLEGLDKNGNPTGGWDLDELRSIQDWTVRYALLSAGGVSEVASIGGFVKEYQVDVDPYKMRFYNVSLDDVYKAVEKANSDVGARTIELNNVEYVIRGLGYIKNVEDIENSVIKMADNVPVYVKNVAKATLGPALRRGILDKRGAEAVGGVVVVRYGANPLETINNVKKKIQEISSSLPSKKLADGVISKVQIVPFYDRTKLIGKTLWTLNSALIAEILITIIVIVLMLRHMRMAGLISFLLPASVLICFAAMKVFGIDANIVALSGIAIAIGTVVDVGIVVSENIVRHINDKSSDGALKTKIFKAVSEVSGAATTAVMTTIVSFIPVFALQHAEGKLFRPLAFTKTFTLAAALLLALTIIPAASVILFRFKRKETGGNKFVNNIIYYVFALFIAWRLAMFWLPLGPEAGAVQNTLFVIAPVVALLSFYGIFHKYYERILAFCLEHKKTFLALPALVIAFGVISWLGIKPVAKMIPDSPLKNKLENVFPGLKTEFMPSLDEGSFLFMPTTMPHASIGEVQDILRKQDMAIASIPEVESAVGKAGRADTPLDPAPLSMIETVINYKSEFLKDGKGRLLRFKHDANANDYMRNEEGKEIPALDGMAYMVKGKFLRDEDNKLIPDKNGKVFRLWRSALNSDINPGRKEWKGINSPDDIWKEIVKKADVPGATSAPKLQPIETRLVMLQSGMRAPIGVKVTGKSIDDIEKTVLALEKELKEINSIDPSTVIADRTVGKPYIEIKINRKAIARYGIKLKTALDVIESAIGGKQLGLTVEGRERYPIRVRYMRELRDNINSLGKILVTAPDGTQIPLGQLAKIEYRRGPQSIKSENSLLVGYVFFDRKEGFSEIDAVNESSKVLNKKISDGSLKLPESVSFSFAGNYENQIRAERRLSIIIPVALLIVFAILMMQFKSVSSSLYVFSGIAVAWAGGFIFLWLYGQEWFMNFSVIGWNFRELFQMHTVNLSVAVWVGFLALFGIATDDGVVMASYLNDSFEGEKLKDKKSVRKLTIEAGKRRVRPCLMTTATTILALIPVLLSKGHGSDVMIPMAIPVFGGMIFEIITMLIVPVLYCLQKEIKLTKEKD
jgi:Cu(I)/Ag(I) efflux system membrane protein CusA/SilA